MTLTDAELRTLAWRTFDCGYCDENAGRRCITASGERTTPHLHRMTQARTWVARQPEVDELTGRLLDLGATVEQAEQALARMTTERDDLRVNVRALTTEVSGLTEANGRLSLDNAAAKTTIAARDVTIAGLRARIAELEKPTTPTTGTLFGAGGGNKDRTKDGIALDRRYYGQADRAKALADVKRNHDAGITSWISFKCPSGWADMAAGKGDAWFDAICADLNALGYDVWLSIHHEPEGDGDTNDWRKMQDHLSRRVPGGVTGRIKFWLTTTGWGQEFGTTAANQWSVLFPTGAPIYGIGYDAPYNTYGFEWVEGVKTTKMNNSWTDPNTYVDKLADRAKSLGVKAAIGEMGYSDEAFAKDKTWLEKVFNRAAERGLEGVAYFDTTLNSKKSWSLGAVDSPKRAYFNQLIAERVTK